MSRVVGSHIIRLLDPDGNELYDGHLVFKVWRNPLDDALEIELRHTNGIIFQCHTLKDAKPGDQIDITFDRQLVEEWGLTMRVIKEVPHFASVEEADVWMEGIGK